jgi:protein-disulfide isomerase
MMLAASGMASAQTMGIAAAQAGHEVPQAELSSILAPPLATPASGSAQGDVTIVDYFDYNCPVCRAIEPALRKVAERDPKVRLVHKDWAIFGDASVYAAYCSFAAAREGKYRQAHDALIGSKEDLDSKDDVRKVLLAAGFDVKALDADIARHAKEYRAVLARNEKESMALGFHGTPGVIVGNQIVQGGDLDYAHLSRLVESLRKGQAH